MHQTSVLCLLVLHSWSQRAGQRCKAKHKKSYGWRVLKQAQQEYVASAYMAKVKVKEVEDWMAEIENKAIRRVARTADTEDTPRKLQAIWEQTN